MSESWTHFNAAGSPHMVSISEKSITKRRAVAKCSIVMKEETRRAIREGSFSPKGNVVQIATIAGIQAAKRTDQWIPLCHPIPLDAIDLHSDWNEKGEMVWTATVEATWKTGVEMEALVAVSAAALTVYDMCKSFDRSMEIRHIALHEKSGGKSGTFLREQV